MKPVSRKSQAASGAGPAAGRKAETGRAGADKAAGRKAGAEAVSILRKKDLVERVAEASGVKLRETRAVVEAVLAELGAALSRGDELALPPLGKARVNRSTDKGEREVLVVKLRRGRAEKPGGGPDEGLAEPAD